MVTRRAGSCFKWQIREAKDRIQKYQCVRLFLCSQPGPGASAVAQAVELSASENMHFRPVPGDQLGPLSAPGSATPGRPPGAPMSWAPRAMVLGGHDVDARFLGAGRLEHRPHLLPADRAGAAAGRDRHCRAVSGGGALGRAGRDNSTRCVLMAGRQPLNETICVRVRV